MEKLKKLKESLIPAANCLIYFTDFLLNDIVAYIPCWAIRRCCYHLKGMKTGKRTTVNMHNLVKAARNISIGDCCHVNRGVILDGRGGLKIGNNVSVSYNVVLMTGGHDPNSIDFKGRFSPIVIEDNVWIGVNATVLQNVKIGKGAVVAAGAVVTKDVPPYTFVAGIPARAIGNRREDIDYKCDNSSVHFL